MKKVAAFIFLGVLLVFFGCANYPEPTKKSFPYKLKSDNIVEIAYNTTDALISGITFELNRERLILVSSFVDINNLNKSSSFGRMIAECIASRLSQHGYPIKEIKLRTSLYMKKGAGEFLLSREIEEISSSHHAQAVAVGTYTKTQDAIVVSSRIIDAETGVIISSYDYKIPMTKNLSQMLR